jgi:signal transduction histidine kinase
MQPPPQTTDLLALRAMPELASMLRRRIDRVIHRWQKAVEKYLPDADPLTAKQVRDSIPNVLEQIANALEAGQPNETYKLEEVGTAHGVARFQQNYNIQEVIIEYRLLRRVLFDEILEAGGDQLNFLDSIPIDMAVDTALERGVVEFVRHLEQNLNSAARAESKYLSYLSHDLRNNLNSITLMLEILGRTLSQRPDLAEEAKDVAALRQSVFETVAGMDRLLQAERLRKHVVELKLGPVNLHQLTADLLSQAARAANVKGLRLENDVPREAAAHSDRELLMVALQNLLGNAVKFSSSGTIRISAREDESGWKVSVSDQGPGIPPQRLAQLFEAFTRGETHGQPGVGLGLAIASHAARILGSEITVDSTPGKGSTFSFSVPPARPEIAK